MIAKVSRVTDPTVTILPVVTMGELLDSGDLSMQNGFPCGKHGGESNGIAQLRPMNVSDSCAIDLRKIVYVNADRETDSYLIQRNDVIFNNTNSEELVGKTALWNLDSPGYTLSNHMTRLRAETMRVLPQFLTYCFFWLWRRGIFQAVCRRHVNQASVSKQRIRPVSLPLPRLNEQRAIAAVLGKLQAAIAAQHAIIDHTAELKAALMAKVFTEGTRGDLIKESSIGPIPDSWRVDRIGNRARIKSGGTPSRNNPRFWKDGTIPWVKTGEVNYCVIKSTEEFITKEGLESSSARMYPPGTLLIAMYGQGVTRGKVAILGIEAATNQACGAILHDTSIVTKYLYHYMAFAYDRLRTHSHGAQQRNLSGEIVANFEIAIPSNSEQAAIADALDRIEAVNNAAVNRFDRHQELFATMLDELMTGRTRINDLDFAELGVATDA